MKIGFIGLGNMGSAIADLLRARHAVTVWNRSANRTRELLDAGGAAAPSPSAAASRGRHRHHHARRRCSARAGAVRPRGNIAGAAARRSAYLDEHNLSGHSRAHCRAARRARSALVERPGIWPPGGGRGRQAVRRGRRRPHRDGGGERAVPLDQPARFLRRRSALGRQLGEAVRQLHDPCDRGAGRSDGPGAAGRRLQRTAPRRPARCSTRPCIAITERRWSRIDSSRRDSRLPWDSRTCGSRVNPQRRCACRCRC